MAYVKFLLALLSRMGMFTLPLRFSNENTGIQLFTTTLHRNALNGLTLMLQLFQEMGCPHHWLKQNTKVQSYT